MTIALNFDVTARLVLAMVGAAVTWLGVHLEPRSVAQAPELRNRHGCDLPPDCWMPNR